MHHQIPISAMFIVGPLTTTTQRQGSNGLPLQNHASLSVMAKHNMINTRRRGMTSARERSKSRLYSLPPPALPETLMHLGSKSPLYSHPAPTHSLPPPQRQNQMQRGAALERVVVCRFVVDPMHSCQYYSLNSSDQEEKK